MNTQPTIKTNLLSIDAWREPEGGWTWNAWYLLQDGISWKESELDSPRKVFKRLRDMGYLSDASKGRVAIEDDQCNVVIKNKDTGEPIFALEYGSFVS